MIWRLRGLYILVLGVNNWSDGLVIPVLGVNMRSAELVQSSE